MSSEHPGKQATAFRLLIEIIQSGYVSFDCQLSLLNIQHTNMKIRSGHGEFSVIGIRNNRRFIEAVNICYAGKTELISVFKNKTMR